MTAFAVEDRIAERAPRVSRKVWEEKSCSQLGGELDWLPREVELLRRNCFKETRCSSQHFGQEGGAIPSVQAAEESLMSGVVQSFGDRLLARPGLCRGVDAFGSW
jgi:hypothetical protein